MLSRFMDQSSPSLHQKWCIGTLSARLVDASRSPEVLTSKWSHVDRNSSSKSLTHIHFLPGQKIKTENTMTGARHDAETLDPDHHAASQHHKMITDDGNAPENSCKHILLPISYGSGSTTKDWHNVLIVVGKVVQRTRTIIQHAGRTLVSLNALARFLVTHRYTRRSWS